ncbi:MAG: phage protease [Desulfocapsaceae bacterium]|nr:phage protease [Desulfocapsaceae bacterium]
MKNTTAINAMEIIQAENGLPEWVCLLPAGPVVGRDGRAWNNSRPEAIIANFAVLARDLPIDIEHATELKGPKGEPAPAMGWIKELQVRDGAVWGRAEWNGTGSRLVADKRYRYLSPVILYQEADRTIVGLTSVGLTNQPNLKLPALNSEQGDQSPKEESMLKALLAALGLPENATEAEAVAAVTGLKTDLATAANRAENPSLEKFVPRADFDAALAKAANAEQSLAEMKAGQLETAINSAIGQALKDGKITPATADYHKAQCKQEGGLAKFAAYCAAAPSICGDTGLDSRTVETGGKALNAQEKEVCAALGISEEDYAKTALS